MIFAEITPRVFPNKERVAKRNEYIELGPGAHTIRILESRAKKFKVHYLNRAYVRCLDDECPVCINNKKLIAQFPIDFRKQPGYSAYTERFYVNVLDKTKTKVCKNCSKEFKNLSTVFCDVCNTILQEAHPLNKVKILAKGKTLFEHLQTINSSILDAEGNPIGINNYDIALIVSGTGRDATYTPIPNPAGNEPVDLATLELFDVSNAVLDLSPEEMLELQAGVSVRDIFAARRSKENSIIAEQVPDELVKQVNEDISKLFKTA